MTAPEPDLPEKPAINAAEPFHSDHVSDEEIDADAVWRATDLPEKATFNATESFVSSRLRRVGRH